MAAQLVALPGVFASERLEEVLGLAPEIVDRVEEAVVAEREPVQVYGRRPPALGCASSRSKYSCHESPRFM